MEKMRPVASLNQIPPGERKIIDYKGIEIGLFNIDGEIHAILNRCPHMGAPLCQGKLQNEIESETPGRYLTRYQTVLRCPWHKWEFRLIDGSCITSPDTRVKVFETQIKNGEIYLRI